jgi:hypothetical protein
MRCDVGLKVALSPHFKLHKPRNGFTIGQFNNYPSDENQNKSFRHNYLRIKTVEILLQMEIHALISFLPRE